MLHHDDLAHRYPILSAHWPNFPSLEDEPPPGVRGFRFRRNVEKLHRLGPRVLHEYLVEVGAQRSIRTFLEDRIIDYATLDKRALAKLGGDRFPPVPIHRVQP